MDTSPSASLADHSVALGPPAIHQLSRARKQSRSQSARTVLHGAAITVAWLLFMAGWVKVWRDSSPGMVVSTLGLLGATLAVSVALTWLWILHNVSIFNRKGPRIARPTMAFADDADFLGQRLEADWGEIAASQVVLVSIDGGIKSFAQGGAVKSFAQGEAVQGEATERAAALAG